MRLTSLYPVISVTDVAASRRFSAATEASYRQRVLRVCQHIEAHLDEPISLPRLAQVACLSPHHFHRIFRALVGESVMEHVRRLRLERAAQRLRAAGDARIIEIALDAGYESHEAFTRAFHAAFGVAPSDYRRAGRRARARQPVPDAPGRPLPVRIQQLPAIRATFMRHVGPYSEVGPTFERLLAWAAGRGLLPLEPLAWKAGARGSSSSADAD